MRLLLLLILNSIIIYSILTVASVKVNGQTREAAAPAVAPSATVAVSPPAEPTANILINTNNNEQDNETDHQYNNNHILHPLLKSNISSNNNNNNNTTTASNLIDNNHIYSNNNNNNNNRIDKPDIFIETTTTTITTTSSTTTTTTKPPLKSTNSIPSNAQYNHNPILIRPAPKICSGVHIRNDLKSFEQLRGCNIIDGPLTIALVSDHNQPYESKDYENITFPDLHEVTEYLLFFRVQGLSTLSGLFPNLSVIRGKELVSNYALIIYEMMHLQQINLPKLADILRGSVRIESNPNLCYVETVNWEAICKHIFTPHFINNNKKKCDNRCPKDCQPWNTKLNPDQTKLQGDVSKLGSENNGSIFCWNIQVCHNVCQTQEGLDLPLGPNGDCCSPQCAGGCYLEDRSDQCIACRSVSQEDKCVAQCDISLFEHKGRCINEQECIQTVESVQQNQCAKMMDVQTSNLKAIRLGGHGKCQVSCPPGQEEDSTNKNKCKPCENGKCRKICTPQGDKPYMVTNVNSLREIYGCNSINGSLEITMKGGINALHELETAFQDLEEIGGYLKITRSYPIITLGFLNKLKSINGSKLDWGQYSLIIIDNPNLQELFMFSKSDSDQKQLTILRGKIFVHLNPKLCPHRIDNLKSYATVADWDVGDVSLHTNGDKEACNTQELKVQFLHGTSKLAMIRFQNFAKEMDDPRSLLYYLINYREVQNGTVSMFDGRDGCNSLNDVWKTIEASPITGKSSSNKSDQYQEVVIAIKPATRYALYVKTFTILAGSLGAISDIIYFETAPDTPGIPKQIESVATSHDSVLVSWSPPSKPNGVIERYLITVTKISELEDFQHLDICESIKNRDKITQALTKDEPTISTLLQASAANGTNVSNDASSTCAGGVCPACKATSDTDADIQAEVVTFQDMIIDIVYLKQPCPVGSNSSRGSRKRRSIVNEPSGRVAATTKESMNIADSSSTSTTSTTENIILSLDGQSPKDRYISQPQIRFNNELIKTEVNITVDRSQPQGSFKYLITNLDHFSLYTIEVVACHGDFESDRTKTSSQYKRCSLQAITQVRTLPIDEYDRIPRDSLYHSPANESSNTQMIVWKKPEKPNGLILAYLIRFKPKNQNSEIWTEACINNTFYNQNRGFNLPPMNPGSYILNVQAVSMYYGQRFWSQPDLEFDIPRDELSTHVALLIVAAASLILVLAIGSLAYVYQKKRHELDNLIYASVNPDYVQYESDEWEVNEKSLVRGEQIGSGSFGMVYKGFLTTEKGTSNCAIKTIPSTSTAKQRDDFLREASIMKQFDTFHVVKLLGVISTTTPVYVIMEHMENGDLKTFLRNQREVHQQANKPLVDGIYLMAAQIADGMAYLASKKFVHRDLAARNCMVGENRVVKIGDFGLTRDVYANDYYRRGTQGRLPVRWMSPEALNDNLYTSASDVWSFGIVVWEMVTFSAYPYQGLSNDEVVKRVKQGSTMPRPENCPDNLFYVMHRCWQRNDRDRPTFNELVEYLLPETDNKLYPNCFYRKPKSEADSIAQPTPEDSNTGTESYPLLLWPSTRANGLTNGVNHVQSDIR